jgi:iron complex outermembrane receptor protein
VEYFEDGDQETGTLYSNRGFEGRFTLSHAHSADRSGVWGLQLTNTEFSAIGEEAFIPESDISNIGIFGVERLTSGRYTAELGVRAERGAVDAGSGCDNSDMAVSLSGSLLYDLNDENNVLLGLSRSQRTPTVEELYSNVDAGGCEVYSDPEQFTLHAATNLLEIGNPDLDVETSNNIELGIRRFAGPFTGQLSVYRNEIDNFVFLDLSGEEFEEQAIARYLSRDATFTGIEGEVAFSLLDRGDTSMELSVFGDFVRAELDSGGNIPRIPAAKLGAELRFFNSDWSAHLHVTRVNEQDDVGKVELPTDAYTVVSLYADYHWQLMGDSELKLFIRGDNLLDEEIRNHASFLKNYAPEPGRSFRLGLRFDY